MVNSSSSLKESRKTIADFKIYYNSSTTSNTIVTTECTELEMFWQIYAYELESDSDNCASFGKARGFRTRRFPRPFFDFLKISTAFNLFASNIRLSCSLCQIMSILAAAAAAIMDFDVLAMGEFEFSATLDLLPDFISSTFLFFPEY